MASITLKPMPVSAARCDTDILHLADSRSIPPHSKALCGKYRDRPLRPGADGEFCVVCWDLARLREGKR